MTRVETALAECEALLKRLGADPPTVETYVAVGWFYARPIDPAHRSRGSGSDDEEGEGDALEQLAEQLRMKLENE